MASVIAEHRNEARLEARGWYSHQRATAWVRCRWWTRPCTICGQVGPCSHREIDVELAELEALMKGGIDESHY